jgi:hypothetical protein
MCGSAALAASRGNDGMPRRNGIVLEVGLDPGSQLRDIRSIVFECAQFSWPASAICLTMCR